MNDPIYSDITADWAPRSETFPIPPPEEAKVFPASLMPKIRSEPFDPDADDGRCKGTSWGPARMQGSQGTAAKKRPDYENFYGPGGYNRCVYTTEEHVQHRDEWGNVFVLEPKFRTLRVEKPR